MTKISILAAGLAASLLIPSCGGSSGDDKPDGGGGDADGGGGGADAARTDGGRDDLGFEIRTPESHSITCSYYPEGFPEDPQDFADSDWLCTFEHGDTHGHIYVRATPTDCGWGFFPYPAYETQLAEIAIDDSVTALENAAYDWGGNHHNDTISFDYAGKRYVYDHSSYGFGWHACQPVDCIRVYEAEELVEDGCTEERTLPIVCVPIKEDGTHDTLEDRFEPCPEE